ncbi:MAG: archaeal proteasome endopeptidase complex subunit beta [Acidilobus sp.]|nr:archaeal proteasome endopeptidase complex subunit beta [Acidilobus sp.]MCG2890974.1 archaeal proteasome endopeptidase complex subunit beta [Acidilobus sp.]
MDGAKNMSENYWGYGVKAWHGTTTVGLVIKDYVVLAADKRATAGFLIASRSVKKIVKITDYAAMTISGLVADAQALADIVREEARYYEMNTGKRLSIYGMATLLANVLFSSKYFPYIVQLIIGGYDTAPRLYAIDPYGGVTEEKMTASGSGSPVALGVLERGYSEDLDLEGAVKLASEAVRSAILRDAATGDGIDVTIIGHKTYQERFIPFRAS